MKVGVGYGNHPDTSAAGVQAARMALEQAGRGDPCDLVLLFATARHEQGALRDAVASVTGAAVPIFGGGAAGVITNDYFGYAGDQLAVTCIWLDGVRCDVLTEGGLNEGEEETGARLGRRLAEIGTAPNAPMMLFYDAFAQDEGSRMLMATWLLAGIEKGLGFLPDLTGAGLIGDHTGSQACQWIGGGIAKHSAMALAFSGDIRMDSVIMHGCRPATQYYTVTKAEGPVVLEINGRPAIPFIDELLNSAITPEQYPFYLIFGVNHGERWGEYNEDYYANRLCLDIDRERGGIVMFEPDMVEGTEFQLMLRSMDLDYMKPKIEGIFDGLGDREPVFAVYIDCAGRAAGYAGMDVEDAPVIQKTVAGRVPVLGLYTGVEIAPIGGRPRGLDWTGVFCLFSQSRDGSARVSEGAPAKPLWRSGTSAPESAEAPAGVMARLAERNAARFLAIETDSIAIRFELEQKRRGFALLAELAVSLRQNASYENVFIPAAKRINAALNMQRTIVLARDGEGGFRTNVLWGYSAQERVEFAGRLIQIPAEFLDPDRPVRVTGEDPPDRLADLRALWGLPYFIASPVILQDEAVAVLITGRTVEAWPHLVRLSPSDAETVQAIGALLASVLAGQRLAAVEERNRIMADAMPICCILWDESGNPRECNRETLSLFGVSDKREFFERFPLSPEYQPDGRRSAETAQGFLMEAFLAGEARFKWMYQTADGEPVPSEVTLTRVPTGESYNVLGYIRDLRDQEAAAARQDEARELAARYERARNEFLASISHEIRTPLNAVAAMARVAAESKGLGESQRNVVEMGMRSAKLLTSAVETILDFSKLDAGRMRLEAGPFSVRSLMSDVGEMAGRDAREKSLSLRVSVDPCVPELLIGDAVRLQQALLNIVMNAVKFTESGGVEIHVRGTPDQGGGFTLAFEVRDTGIGISEEKMALLFTPFSADTAYDRKYEGMGMGLSVSHGLAKLMGGSLVCESRPGEGSAFTLTIPLSLPAAETAEAEGAETDSPWETLRGLRVLVAEDNSINQMIIEDLLTTVGIKVTLAENGVRALEALARERFDVVLMDIQMPEMDGLTATSHIRAERRYEGLPVLAMTANAGAEHLRESMNAGMNDHLTKPVEVEKLYQAIQKWSKRGIRL